MKSELFDELVQSVREGGSILRVRSNPRESSLSARPMSKQFEHASTSHNMSSQPCWVSV